MKSLRSLSRPLALSLLVLAAVSPALADESTIFAPIERETGVRIGLRLKASGFANPVKAVNAPGEPGRLYVVDQIGKLWAVDLSTGAKSLLLDVSDRLVVLGIGPAGYDERGFLGAAFHPNYRCNGKFYTYTSEPTAGTPTFPSTLPSGIAPNHQNVIAEWRAVNPGHPEAGVLAGSRRELLRIDWPQFNHDAGDMAFGPDGKLYFSMGDGGGSDDEDGDLSLGPPAVVGHPNGGNAQNLGVVFGKIHRIDVDGHDSVNGQYGIPADNPFVSTPGAVKEIFAYGLRNPYRFSFDSGSGRLFVGDVGQNDLEEVDVIVKGGNYGWPHKEGTLCFDRKGVDPGVATPVCPPNLPSGLIDPIAQYDTDTEGVAVSGGFVYRGHQIKALRGRYVFGEWSRLFAFATGPDNYGRIFYLKDRHLGRPGLRPITEVKGLADAAAALGLTDPARVSEFPQTLAIGGWGQDTHGEIYVVGNRTGRPSGTGGVLLELTAARGRHGDDGEQDADDEAQDQ